MADLVVSELHSGSDAVTPPKRRLVDVLDSRLVNLLTVLGFAVPVGAYLWIVYHYSVNVIFGDQLTDVSVVKASYAHFVPWGALWAQYRENRLFFPNLVVELMAHTDHFNIPIEEFVSATMLIAATALIIWAHKVRAPSTPWLYYCPVGLLTFSLVQYQNTLWGYQLAWYLVLLSLAAAMILLDRVRLTWLVLLGAVSAAAVGSFSSIQGLLIWPTGLVLLYHRRRSAPFVLAWIGVGIGSAVLYMYNLNLNAVFVSSGQSGTRHPWSALKFFLFAVGDVAGFPVKRGHGDTDVLLFGLIIVLLALAVVVAYGIRRDDSGGSPIGVALICFGLLFAGFITQGRVVSGYWGAAQSRYTTYDLMILVGAYLSLLGRPTLWRSERRAQPGPGVTGEPRGRRWAAWATEGPVVASGLSVLRWTAAAVIFVQVLVGIQNGLDGDQNEYRGQTVAAQVSHELAHLPNRTVREIMDPYAPASYARQQVGVLEAHHLSLFAQANTG